MQSRKLNEQLYPLELGGYYYFAISEYIDQSLRTRCSQCDISAEQFSDGSILLVGDREQMDQFWTFWVMVTDE